MRLLIPILFLLMPVVASAQHANHEDHEGVRMAVLDYLEGIYDVEPERIERSVSKDLVKFGYWRGDPSADYRSSPMNYEQLHSLAGSWNVDNRQGITADSPREIVVLDVLDKTAAAKLTAHWGIDYFQLEKIDGRWMIRHVLWQSPPATD
ncbi:MAG: nuclear transport factor 2 family protein [Rhodothermales bacterium]|nr:nuclear transport factor 2 family protein [Rhodothermales bacterium]MBO6781211.1 nuclear transport factor 2 family protein [Rhodothermales bacterium]